MSKHETFKVEKCGTFLGKIKSYRVASPNGIVTYKCHGKGLIEIKFSYSIRDKTSQNLLQNVTNILKNNGRVTLSRKPQMLCPSYFSNVNYKKCFCFFAV